jgi:PmbA protein
MIGPMGPMGRMSNPSLQDVAEALLAAAKRHGATAADVVVAEGESLDVGVRFGAIEKLKQARQKHLGLRVLIGARSAVTSSADFTRQAIERLAEDTCALARVIAPDPFAGLPDAADLATRIPELDLYDPDVAAITAERAIEWAKDAEQAALDADARITNSEGAEVSASTDHLLYASSLGFRGEYRNSGVSLSVVPVAAENGGMQRDYWYSAQRKLAELEAPAAVGRKAAARALRRLRARQVATCEVPVIFDPETAAGLLRHLAAAVSGTALYKGTSFLVGRLGQRIAPEWVTVVDDGTRAGGLGSKPFDGEGLPTRRTMVVDRGVLRSYLFDCYSARKLQSRSTGNAARSVGSAPGVAPTNFCLEAGTTAPEDILRSVGRGLYVTELIGFGVNPVTGDYSRGAVGQWIEHGEVAYPVEEITIAGNLLAMYDAIEVVGNDLEFRRSVVAPTIKIGRMTVAGS